MSADCSLYLITPPVIDDLTGFCASFSEALDAGGVACVQLRLKGANGPVSDETILAAASRLLPLARARDVAFLINDRADLAKKAGADGVHLGQSDGTVGDARALLGHAATIGVTCHDSRHLGLVAGEQGADYVAFGAFYPTPTKDAPTRAEPSLLEWWSYATTLPCVAIGGITPGNCQSLVRAGADFLAVSSAVWNSGKGPGEAVRAFSKAIRSA